MNDMASLPSLSGARLPGNYEAAKQALAECQSLDECKDWSDKAAALASYAKQSQDDELEIRAKRIRARAVRRSGELLRQIETQQGSRTDLKLPAHEGERLSRSDAAMQAGISPKQTRTAVNIANIPQDDFDRQVEGDAPPTLTQLAQQGIKPKPVMDLNGRDPREFNNALHFVGDFEQYAKDIRAKNIETCSTLTDSERQRIRAAINRIDAIHDQIMTRI